MKFLIDLEFTPSPNEKPMMSVWIQAEIPIDDGDKKEVVKHRLTGGDIENLWPAELSRRVWQLSNGDVQVLWTPSAKMLIEDDFAGQRHWPKFFADVVARYKSARENRIHPGAILNGTQEGDEYSAST